jgi:hypothetical protein
MYFVGGARRNRTADEGFADPCLTTWLPRHRLCRDQFRALGWPHPSGTSYTFRHSYRFGSSGKRHLGVLLAALPMNQAHTLWCAGAAGEVAAYRFTNQFPNSASGRAPKSRKPTNQSFWWWAATTPVEKSALLSQPPRTRKRMPAAETAAASRRVQVEAVIHKKSVYDAQERFQRKI